MPLTKCPRCGTLFDKISFPVCRGCTEDEEQDYEVIRDAVQEHPELNAEAVAELTGVDLKCVMRMLDAGRIANIQIGAKVECGRCGAPAISMAKRLCQGCLDKLNREMMETKQKIRLDSRKKNVEIGGYTTVRDELNRKRKT